jgi:hypothetical protein
MAATVDSKVEVRPATYPKSQVQVVNGQTIFSGSQAALCGFDHATAANRGRLKAYAAVAGEVPFGWKIFASVLGNTSPGSGVQIPEGEVYQGSRFWEAVTVTGLTGDQTDVGREVYMSDDNTWTLTRPTRGIPMGIIVRSTSATTADVMSFSVETLLAMALAGSGHNLMYLGVLDSISLANGNMNSLAMTAHGRLKTIYAVNKKVNTGAGATATLTPQINGVNCSAGVITLLLADTLYQQKTGTALTAFSPLDVFHDGDTLRFVISGVVAFTAGLYDLYAEYVSLPGV